MSTVLEAIRLLGVVPVVTLSDPREAVPLARALCEGGLPCAEVTFRTEAAGESIRRIAAELPDMLVGAGTVLTTRQADDAIAAGAKFIVSPGLNPEVVRHCLARGVTVVPGCTGPSEIEQALALGLDTVKFFPAEAMGGLKVIKALAAPYTGVRFMPTGGINPSNLEDYLAFDRVVACGGSWMADSRLIRDGRFDEIARLTRQAARQLHGFELLRVGLNSENSDAAAAAARTLCGLFGFALTQTDCSACAAGLLEFTGFGTRGTLGRLCVGVHSVSRAAHYLKRLGCALDEPERDVSQPVFLREEIGGFAVMLVSKKEGSC